MKVLITGADGLLAYALNEAVRRDVELVRLRHEEFDLMKPDQMREQLRAHRPELVINTAAYNMVDRCEVERELSWAINAKGPHELAELCAETGCRLVHYSTDYVFDGSKGETYVEADAPNPVNYYAAGKLAGERAVLSGPNNLVLRLSWLFGWHPTQRKSYVHTVLNQVRKKQNLKATTDQSSAPTYGPDLARWTLELVERGATGLWHAVNDDGLSRFEWTKMIVEEIARVVGLPRVAVEPVTTAWFNPTVRRPTCTVLSNAKLSRFLGRPLGSWKDGLRELLAKESRARL